MRIVRTQYSYRGRLLTDFGEEKEPGHDDDPPRAIPNDVCAVDLGDAFSERLPRPLATRRLAHHETISDECLGHVDGELDCSDRIDQAIVAIKELRHGEEIMRFEKEASQIDVNVEGHMLLSPGLNVSGSVENGQGTYTPRAQRRTWPCSPQRARSPGLSGLGAYRGGAESIP